MPRQDNGDPPRRANASAARPNVLIIHTDQHRMDCLGAYGNEEIQTPNIDRLAGEGIQYSNSFCPYPVCTPSRYSLLSGLYVHEHRGWGNGSTLPPGTETIPSILRSAGYRTKAVGKMHFNPTYLDVGFEELALSPGYFPNAELTEPKLRRIMAHYYGAISQIDHHVGRMIRVLQERGLYDDTLIVFTSDHGDYMGFHHLVLKGNHMYDPLVKVPLILKLPGSAQAGTVSSALVNNIDVAPTILAQTDCAPGSRMTGLDLLAHPEGRELVFCETRHAGQLMVRSATRKLIVAPRSATRLFFDLGRDPLEMHDLSSDPAYRSDLRRLDDALAAWVDPDNLPPDCRDPDAPCINQPNVPPPDDERREDMMDYFRRQMGMDTP